MEKMTRMSKYKELRESLKNDVVTTEETQAYVANEEIVKDANYYRNLVGEDTTLDKQVEIKNPVKEDTLYESLTFDTITENETEEVKSVLEKVRENSGQEQFNTRMDILNKIRQSKVEVEEVKEEIQEEIEEAVEEVFEEEKEEPVVEANRFGYVKEEEVEEIEDQKEEDEEEEEEKPRKRGLFGRKKKEEEVVDNEDDEDDEEEEEDEEEEGSSFMIKLLNGCIIVLVLVLLGLVAFIAKEILL